MSMSDHRATAARAVQIVDRLGDQGYSPRRKTEILAVAQQLVAVELVREQAELNKPPQDEVST
jgi:hypothetical protein